MAIMRGDDDICSDTINASVECVNSCLDFRNHSRLQFLPSTAGVLPANAVNSIMGSCLYVLFMHLICKSIFQPPRKYNTCQSTMVLPRRTLHLCIMATNG